MNLVSFEVRFSPGWTTLQYKNEYKIKTREQLFYQTLSDEVYSIALSLDLDYKLAETLARVHGFSFVPNGMAGWNALEEIFKERNFDIDINKLKANLVKRLCNRINEETGKELAPYIDEMFSDNVTTPEVLLVIEAFKILKKLEPFTDLSLKYFYEVEGVILDEFKRNYLKTGKFEEVDIMPYVPDDMPVHTTTLSKKDLEEVKQEYNEILDDFISKYPDYSLEEHVLIATSYYVLY